MGSVWPGYVTLRANGLSAWTALSEPIHLQRVSAFIHMQLQAGGCAMACYTSATRAVSTALCGLSLSKALRQAQGASA